MVLAPSEPAAAEPGLDFLAGGFEERPCEALGCEGAHGRDSGGPGAAEQAEQNGFRLIVSGVSQGHAVHLAGGEKVAKKTTAKLAGSFLAAVSVWGGGLTAQERDAVCAGEFSGELLVGGGFGAAPVVIDVEHGEGPAVGRRKLRQQGEQAG